MIKLFGEYANTEARESLGLGTDGNETVIVNAEGVNVEIVGQKKDDVDIKLTGDANVSYDLVERELVIMAKNKESGNGEVPTMRVYLPINVGVRKVNVYAEHADVTIDSKVTRQYITTANVCVRNGDVHVGNRQSIYTLNILK